MSGVTVKRKAAVDPSPAKKVKTKKEEEEIDSIIGGQQRKKITIEEFYALEDAQANGVELQNLKRGFGDDAAAIRQYLEAVVKGEEVEQPDLLLPICSMRRCHRLAQYNMTTLKKDAAERLSSVEAKYLQLQNASSEIHHLQKEIARCLEFRSSDEGIDLVPVDEFREKAPANLSRAECTSDEHKLRVARLNYEMLQRKELVSTLTELEGRRAVLNSDITKKEQRLGAVPVELDKIAKAAAPLQQLLGVKPEAAACPKQRALAGLLPTPLALLHAHTTAYKEMSKDEQLDVVVSGDAAEAERLRAEEEEERGEEKEREEREGSQDEERAEEERLQRRRAALLRTHPVVLELHIGCGDDVTVQLHLQYLLELRVTLLKWKVEGRLPSFGGVAGEKSLLDELVAGDTGEECPDPVGAAKLAQLKVSLAGGAFRWAQQLCGGSGEEGARVADRLERLVDMVRGRVAARIALAKQMKAIASCKLFSVVVAATAGVPKQPKTSTQLASAAAATEEEWKANVAPCVFDEVTAAGSLCGFMRATAENKKSGVKSTAWIALSSRHPSVAPHWTVKVEREGADVEGAVQAVQSRLAAASSSAECEPEAVLIYQIALWLTALDGVVKEEEKEQVEKEEPMEQA